MNAESRPRRPALVELWQAYRMRWVRRRLLFRAFRKRHQISVALDQTNLIGKDSLLAFVTLRNESLRLPYFLKHHRALGVQHFLIVDNNSTDGSFEYLKEQPDVSVWRTQDSYKLSRFGMDWLTWLQLKFGAGHWCLTLDVDELFVYPDYETRGLRELTSHLDSMGQRSMGALMLDLYPKGHLSDVAYAAGDDPTNVLNWFDAKGYVFKYQENLRNLLIRGGVRARMFFGALPERVPTLSKTPLVKWSRRYVYVSSTHSILPRRLNDVRGDGRVDLVTGVLLHTKFLPNILEKSAEEKERREHFENSDLFDAYYDSLINDPVLWDGDSMRYAGPDQLIELGLMQSGNWR